MGQNNAGSKLSECIDGVYLKVAQNIEEELVKLLREERETSTEKKKEIGIKTSEKNLKIVQNIEKKLIRLLSKEIYIENEKTKNYIKKAHENYLKLKGYTGRKLENIINKDREEIMRAFKIIEDVGLSHWSNEDIGIYDAIVGRVTHKERRKIYKTYYGAVRLGTKIAKNTEILINYAKSDSPIIIFGETGTGKELLANVIHKLSNRKGEFIIVNSAELSESLFESEMFGHIKGAFTGAASMKKGLLESAHEGTFFLDELGKMPKSLQAKMLRVIENETIRKVGGEEGKKFNVRYIVALQQKEKDNVLPDLLARLKYPDAFRLPNLNKQIEKYKTNIIGSSLMQVMKKLELGPSSKTIGIDGGLEDFLLSHNYTFNYRELENILRYALMHRDPHYRNILSMVCIEDLLNDTNYIPAIADTVKSDKIYPTMNLSKALTEENELEPLFIENDAVRMMLDYENINIDGIFSHIEKVGSLIAKGMVMHIHKKYGNFKKAWSESESKSTYVNYMQKMERKLGMNVRDLVKKYTDDHPNS